ncbi:entericidin A/B family lipoprotein [Paraglaciecola hydrolytica]|nr:entericidin A/B family lipoprotein [Paraglaciecola hydrolytica]
MKLPKLSFFKTLALCCTLLIGLASCATIEGAGKDIESAGEAVQDAAN